MPKRRKFIQQISLGTIGLGTIPLFSQCTVKDAPLKTEAFQALPRSTPEEQGIASSAIRQFLMAANQSGLEFHSLMLIKNAHVVAETWWHPFAREYKHTLYSLSKSFTSTAVGMAIADGLLSVEDFVLDYFPNDAPEEVSEHLAGMKIKHLLTMNTGHSEKPMGKMQEAPDDNWARVFLSEEITHEPGTHFLYNTGATYMLSAIVQKVTGTSLHKFLETRLFKPLNITGSDWETDPNGINVGGYGLRIRTEDIAKLGQLYLQNGVWNGEQLIPESWVREATSKQTESQEGDGDWSQGYGYQFWRCKPAPGFYRGDGAFGQYCIVIPQNNTVIAVTSESKDMQASMNLIWDHILPALGENEKLAIGSPEWEELKVDLQNQNIPPPELNGNSPLMPIISMKEFSLEKNERQASSIAFSFEDKKCTISIKHNEGMQYIKCGMGKWVVDDNKMNIDGSLFVIPKHQDISSKVAASTTWKDDTTLLVNLKYVEGIHGDIWTCKFQDKEVKIDFESSVSLLQNRKDQRKSWTGYFT